MCEGEYGGRMCEGVSMEVGCVRVGVWRWDV